MIKIIKKEKILLKYIMKPKKIIQYYIPIIKWAQTT